jgi:hypothetical protein
MKDRFEIVKKTFKASDFYKHFTTNKSALPELEKEPNYDKKMLKIVEDMETKDCISKAKDAEKKRLEEIEKASLDPQKPHQKKQNLKDPITGQTTGTGYMGKVVLSKKKRIISISASASAEEKTVDRKSLAL